MMLFLILGSVFGLTYVLDVNPFPYGKLIFTVIGTGCYLMSLIYLGSFLFNKR